MYLIFLETRIIGPYFAADTVHLPLLKFCWWAPRNFVYFCKNDVSAVQGHPRSLILAPIESAYTTSIKIQTGLTSASVEKPETLQIIHILSSRCICTPADVRMPDGIALSVG